jgi:putative ABC transport system substrate-binding protein
VVVEWRSAEGDYARVPPLAADLVQHKVDVIVLESTVAAQAVKRATSTIPVVMAIVADPVGSGVVSSLAHPGGNLTGFSLMGVDLSAKRLQLLSEAIPTLTRVAVLWNPGTPFHGKAAKDIESAARTLSISVTLVAAERPSDFPRALSAAKQAHAQALYVMEDPVFILYRKKLLDATARAKLPCIYSDRNFPDQGGFISYGADLRDMFRRSVQYVDRILKGAKPADLPIEQPTKFELVVNLKTAKALGLTLPESILLRADEVIR